MLRWPLFLLAISLLILGFLTVTRSPDWSPWKLAVLAGEFGHWLAALAAVVALAAGLGSGSEPWIRGSTAASALAAAGLLLVPAWQARRVAADLPSRLGGAFGPARLDAPAFRGSELFLGEDPPTRPPQTLEVAPGLPLDFYRPPAADGDGPRRPCVILIHGGGWESGDRGQLPKLNHWIASRGFAVAAVSYRLAPAHRWPAQREDVERAIAFLRERAPALGIDPDRLVLVGRSAGGQIAQVVAYTSRLPAIRGVVGLYAPSDLIFGYVNTHENDMLKSPALMRRFLGGTPDSARAAYESASGWYHVRAGMPPTLLLHGRNDALAWYRHSERLAARLAEHRVPHVYVELPWATHGFDYNLHGPGGQITRFALEWFLRRVTEPPVHP
ncbi:MAG: alpha/beta hydrolase [Verrucomicrobia bacterium]|nr:alpha/beta hydrolase [Verrucomicrobiota bacterium]